MFSLYNAFTGLSLCRDGHRDWGGYRKILRGREIIGRRVFNEDFWENANRMSRKIYFFVNKINIISDFYQ